MEFREVIRRRHMTRTFDGRPVAHDVLERIVEAGRRAPSAGFTQGTALVVLEGSAQTATFWKTVTRPGPIGRRWAGLRSAAAIILPLADRQAYLDRYAETDKSDRGMDVPSGWVAPYWDIDAAFASMAMLLAATNEGIGTLFFAIAHGQRQLLQELGVPARMAPLGALALGYPLPEEAPSPSLVRGRRPTTEIVHWGGWQGRPPAAERSSSSGSAG